MGRWFVGVSGWRYASWRGHFYPAGLPQRLELTYAAERMTAIEINGSFYSLQRPASYAAWRDATPRGFTLAVKGGRFITHMKRLRDVEAALANFFASGILALGPKLGPVLWQLPESLAFDEDLVDGFLGLLPRTTAEAARLAQRHDAKVPRDRAHTTAEVDAPVHHALEPRHASFDSDAARDLLARHDVATVVADSAGRWPVLRDETGPLRYVRLHGATELYASGYDDEALDAWATRCLAWLGEGWDVHVYFDNDARGHAPYDAVRLCERLRAAT